MPASGAAFPSCGSCGRGGTLQPASRTMKTASRGEKMRSMTSASGFQCCDEFFQQAFEIAFFPRAECAHCLVKFVPNLWQQTFDQDLALARQLKYNTATIVSAWAAAQPAFAGEFVADSCHV